MTSFFSKSFLENPEGLYPPCNTGFFLSLTTLIGSMPSTASAVFLFLEERKVERDAIISNFCPVSSGRREGRRSFYRPNAAFAMFEMRKGVLYLKYITNVARV